MSKSNYVSKKDYDQNSFYIPLFQVGDSVRYNNDYLQMRHNVRRDAVGEVVSRVEGEQDVYVVEFGENAFVISGQNLTRHFFKNKQDGPSIDKVLRKWRTEDEDEK